MNIECCFCEKIITDNNYTHLEGGYVCDECLKFNDDVPNDLENDNETN